MKSVLFICRANVGRSQMAAVLFNTYATKGHADSAGIRVDNPGETIAQRAEHVEAAGHAISAMMENGTDISDYPRTQVTEEMLSGYDKIIVMAEPEMIPEWLANAKGYEYWEVADAHHGSLQEVKRTRDTIKEKVMDLIKNESL